LFLSYLLFLMVLSPFLFASSDIGNMLSLFIRCLMLDILCSCGWHESFGIMMSVCVRFLYIVYSSFCSCRRIVRSRKFMDLCVTFSIVFYGWLLVVC
jgi:hypothetical protein